MVAVGLVATMVTWTYLPDGASTKIVVRNICLFTVSATALSKLLMSIISGLTNIPHSTIQKIGVDLARKKLGLDKDENSEPHNDNHNRDADSPGGA